MNKSRENLVCTILGVNLGVFWVLFVFGIFQIDGNLFSLLLFILAFSAPLFVVISFSPWEEKIKNCRKVAIGLIIFDFLQCLIFASNGFIELTNIIAMAIHIFNVIFLISFKNVNISINSKTRARMIKSFCIYSIIWFFILIFLGPNNYTNTFIWIISVVLLGVIWSRLKGKIYIWQSFNCSYKSLSLRFLKSP